MIVATAGHIDHGKTRLVRAITGVDTDRLPEEKARGISIDLGFAYWTAASGTLIGFVDVPGHERFVRNMLAGVCGIDFAMVVVAADDGVMPQTLEHVQILDLLGIRRGIVVMTKVDRVANARRREVRSELDGLLAGTTLQGLNILEASPITGEGIEALKAAISFAAATMGTRLRSGQHFRFAVDRSFSVEGSGTIVTGTVFSGELDVGARLRVSPDGAEVRARGLRVHASDVTHVQAGQRCAINLSGVAVAEIARGDWVVAEAIHRPTQRIDAEMVLLPGKRGALTPATRVHLHLGAGDVLARIIPFGGDAMAPGTRALVELVLDRPVSALHGDRFILRDSAAHRTLGGGRVLDPFAPATRRRKAERLVSLAALTTASAQEALQALLQTPAGVNLDRFETTFNLVPEAARALYRALDVISIGGEHGTGIARARHAAWSDDVHARLAEYHEQHPAAHGMRLKDLRDAVVPAVPVPLFEAFVQEIAGERRITVKGGAAHLTEHDAAANPADRLLWERIYPILLAAGIQPPRLQELASEARVDERTLRDMLYRRRAAGAVYRVGQDRFCLRAILAALAATAASLAQSSPMGSFTAAEYRDALGSDRSLAIELLECLDGVGVTLRVGDTRRIHHDYVPLLGPSAPVARAGDSRSAMATHEGDAHA